MSSIIIGEISKIAIEPTTHCNLHCPQCFRFDDSGCLVGGITLAHLDFDRIKNNIELEMLTNLTDITLEGSRGDPLMHPDILNIINFFSEFNISLFTNASLRGEDFWGHIASYKNLTIVFAIDGLDDTNHIYRINSNYDKIISNAKSFINNGGRAIWKFVVFKHNEHQIDKARQLSKTLGFCEFVTVDTTRSWNNSNTWNVMVNNEYLYDIHPSTNAITESKNKPVTTNLSQMSLSDNEVITNDDCAMHTNKSVHIDYLGHVLPCCMTVPYMTQDGLLSKLWRRIIGKNNNVNLQNFTLSDILNGEFYQKGLQNSFKQLPFAHPSCIRCKAINKQ
jgi:MoaA/NifB/PqqE/SkfB family radical SAM enzyme